MDDFKVWHSGDVTSTVLQVESAGALGALLQPSPASSYRLGCLECTAEAAAAACAGLTQRAGFLFFRPCSFDE